MNYELRSKMKKNIFHNEVVYIIIITIKSNSIIHIDNDNDNYEIRNF